MAGLRLYHCPGACSQVSLYALEQSGLSYTLGLVDLAAGAQNERGFIALNAMRKVPVLVAAGARLTETAGILTYLAAEAPHAGIFPPARSSMDLAERYAGIAFCGTNLHPLLRGMANPGRLTSGDVQPVIEKSLEVAQRAFDVAERRLADTGWWLGTRSAVDVYLHWAFAGARAHGFAVTAYPLLRGLSERVEDLPAFRRMQAIESEAVALLAADAA